jgi:plasmid maintenance system antidote protein VapI
MSPNELKARLDHLGLGTSKAAEALDVSRFTIMNWLFGRRRIPEMVAFALDDLERTRDRGSQNKESGREKRP